MLQNAFEHITTSVLLKLIHKSCLETLKNQKYYRLNYASDPHTLLESLRHGCPGQRPYVLFC